MTTHSKSNHTMQALQQREKELKRSRGQIACAECRRLKLRCDKKVPCASCVRRGCRSICPNGVLSGGQGTRFVLADTEELHLKLVDMSERIRQLEDALEISQARSLDGPHPLLCNDLKAIKYVVGHNIASENDIPRHIHDPLDSFGALKISDDGESRFLGPSAGSEGILLSKDDSYEREENEKSRPKLPPRLFELAKMWPFTPIDLPKDDIRVIIDAQLPTRERADQLVESYLENVGWYNMPVDREEIIDELLPSIYKRLDSLAASAQNNEPLVLKSDNHELALLLMVFACGAAMDRSKDSENDEGQLYFHLARIALGLQPIFESSCLATVQALTLMAVYDVVAIRKTDLEESWKVVFVASVIAGSIGLHRDPGRWNLDPKVIERRRRVFWEMYLVCTWQCLAGGRPPPIVRTSLDVQFPRDVDAIEYPDGKSIPGYKMWKLQYLKECLAPVTDRLCADSTPLKYYEIINFDKKIREFEDIDVLRRDTEQTNGDDGNIPDSLKNKMLCYKSLLRLYLHRNFFGKAISEFPGNPRQPPFGMSFLIVFNIAVSVLDMLYQIRSRISGWVIHFWTIVAHALECGFIVGSVATRCPRTSYAEPAFKSLEIAIELFQGIKHPVGKNGLPVLLRLRDKALQAKYSSHIVPSNGASSSSNVPATAEDIDELSILRGSSRLVAHSSEKRSSPTNSSSSPSNEGSLFLNKTMFDPKTFPNYFDAGTNTQAYSQVHVTTDQVPPMSFQDLGALNWSDVLNLLGNQGLQPDDLSASIEVDDRTFTSLVPDAYCDVSQHPESWNFGESPFSI